MKNKILLVTLVFAIFLLCVVIANPVSAGTSNQIGNVTVSTLTGGSIEVNENTATVTLDSNAVNQLAWHPAVEGEVKRPANGWWIGFKLTFDQPVNDKNVQCTYTNYLNESQGTKPINLDTNTTYSSWVLINDNVLKGKEGELTVGTFKYTSDDSTVDLTVVVKISNPKEVKLKVPTNGVKVTVDGVTFTMEKNKTLKEGLTESEMADLDKLMTPKSGYRLDGLYDGDTKVDLESTKFSDNKDLKVKFEKIPSSSGSSTPNVDNIVVEEVNKTDDKAMGGTSSSAEKDVIIETLKEELKTNKELANKLAGKFTEINVEFSDANSSVASEVKTKMEEAAKKVADNLKIDAFYNIEVAVLANNIKVGNLKELTKPIELKLSMPEGLGEVAKGYTRKYYVIREHDGKVTVLDTNVSEDGKYITFKTDKFSTYALAYKDEKIDNSKNDPNLDKTPKTGDQVYVAFGLLAVSLVSACVMIKRKNH